MSSLTTFHMVYHVEFPRWQFSRNHSVLLFEVGLIWPSEILFRNLMSPSSWLCGLSLKKVSRFSNAIRWDKNFPRFLNLELCFGRPVWFHTALCLFYLVENAMLPGITSEKRYRLFRIWAHNIKSQIILKVPNYRCENYLSYYIFQNVPSF